MFSTMRTATRALSLFSAIANAHMFLSSPTPIEGNAVKPPLDPSGADFPCHGVSLPTSGGQSMAAGSQQLLAWELGNGANTAVHGGGSCQISITYETDATKVKDPSNWHVIYSIEGGCPSNTIGNLDAQYHDATGQSTYSGAMACSNSSTNGVDCVNQFAFTIPKGVKNGNAILAWTWFNTVGNREMYMNCVNANFTGGDGSEVSSFPPMFVANVAVGGSTSSTCGTSEDVAVQFPNPGKYTTTKSASPRGPGPFSSGTYKLAVPTGSGCAPGTGAAVPAAATAAASSPGAYSPGAYSQPTTAPITIQTAPPVPTSIVPAAAPSPAPAHVGNGSAPGATTPSGYGGCSAGLVPCSPSTAFFCVSRRQFGMCEPNGCALPQNMALGTECQDGGIVAASKRDLESAHRKHMRKHIAGRISF